MGSFGPVFLNSSSFILKPPNRECSWRQPIRQRPCPQRRKRAKAATFKVLVVVSSDKAQASEGSPEGVEKTARPTLLGDGFPILYHVCSFVLKGVALGQHESRGMVSAQSNSLRAVICRRRASDPFREQLRPQLKPHITSGCVCVTGASGIGSRGLGCRDVKQCVWICK